MCGIRWRVYRRRAEEPLNQGRGRLAAESLVDTTGDAVLKQRGPDSFKTMRLPAVLADGSWWTPSCHWAMDFSAAVLHLQGNAMATQPLTQCTSRQRCSNEDSPSSETHRLDDTSSHLAYNGEMFDMCEEFAPPRGVSDTAAVLAALVTLERASIDSFPDSHPAADEAACRSIRQSRLSLFEKLVTAYFEAFCGPFAFIYVSEALPAILFGRDALGRRSLVVHANEEECCVASVSQPPVGASPWTFVKEVPICGIISLDLNPQAGNNIAAASPSGDVPPSGSWLSSCTFPALRIALLSPWTIRHSSHPLVRSHVDSQARFAAFRRMLRDLPHTNGEASWSRNEFVVSLGVPPPPPVGICRVESGNAIPLCASTLEHADVVHWLQLQPWRRGVPDDLLEMATSFLNALMVSVQRRVQGLASAHTPIMVPFSGGIDCTVLAAIAHFVLPLSVPIELVNVAFGSEPHATPDRLAAVEAFRELRSLPHPTTTGQDETVAVRRPWRFVLVDVAKAELAVLCAPTGPLRTLLLPCDTVMDMCIGAAIWFAVRGEGRLVVDRGEQPPSSNTVAGAWAQSHQLRYQAHPVAAEPPLDASVNAATTLAEHNSFERVVVKLREAMISYGRPAVEPPGITLAALGKDHPDTMRQLVRAAPGCKRLGEAVRLVVNGGHLRMTTKDTAARVILQDPADVAAARAVEASRRGEGLGEDVGGGASTSAASYRSTARVVILGMGADETLGGYMRHSKVFSRGGEDALRMELNRDFERLWTRNLGRDDRVVSCHGREGRFPYLDEDVLACVSRLPLTAVCNPALRAGEGDKRILRQAAKLLGLDRVTHLAKRAIQFGTRIANRHTQGGQPLGDDCDLSKVLNLDDGDYPQASAVANEFGRRRARSPPEEDE